MSRYISDILIAAALFVAHLLGFWIQLGAHPFWSQSATLFGLVIGVVLIVLTWGRPSWGVVVLLVALTILAFQTSTIGKAEFAESFAENQFAGRIWYYGFIGFIAALFASFSVLGAKITRQG